MKYENNFRNKIIILKVYIKLKIKVKNKTLIFENNTLIIENNFRNKIFKKSRILIINKIIECLF